MVMRDVPTQWNYTHTMIERALLLQDAVDTWVFRSKKLRSLLISPAERQTLQQLGDILTVGSSS
ncbi:hypothetical protein OH77DRAFT_1415143 [Trametes cingulata]|nr:hypothetical protein OH77DRAFT_1415143 [Trametes cingulata]